MKSALYVTFIWVIRHFILLTFPFISPKHREKSTSCLCCKSANTAALTLVLSTLGCSLSSSFCRSAQYRPTAGQTVWEQNCINTVRKPAILRRSPPQKSPFHLNILGIHLNFSLHFITHHSHFIMLMHHDKKIPSRWHILNKFIHTFLSFQQIYSASNEEKST